MSEIRTYHDRTSKGEPVRIDVGPARPEGRFEPNTHYDPDLVEALESGGEAALEEALNAICTCGHARRDHYAATGALASFGGSACENCWTCGTFNEGEPVEREESPWGNVR